GNSPARAGRSVKASSDGSARTASTRRRSRSVLPRSPTTWDRSTCPACSTVRRARKPSLIVLYKEAIVSGEADRDRAVDDVLRRSRAGQSRAGVGTPSDDCLDPETLALWADDGLSAAERATAER